MGQRQLQSEGEGTWPGQAGQKDTGAVPEPDALSELWKTDVRPTEERQRPGVLLLPGALLSMDKRSLHL